MITLYKILVIDAKNDDNTILEMKKLVYQLTYMDNLALTDDNEENLLQYSKVLSDNFAQYCFPLQQFTSNSQVVLKDLIHDNLTKVVPLMGIFRLILFFQIR